MEWLLMKDYVCIVEVEIVAESKEEAQHEIRKVLKNVPYCNVPTIIIGEETTKYCYCKEVIQ